MRRSLIAMVPSLAILVLLARPLAAQDTLRVPDTPECADCLGLELVLSFGFADDEGALLTRDPLITRLPDGRWVVLEASVRGIIRIYDPDGSFQRTIDARGEGPGEYRGLSHIFPNGTGGFVLYDGTNARLSQVDEDFSFLSSSPFHLQNIRMEALSGGSFIVNALLPSAAARGNVVHVVDSTGTVLASFGGSGRPIDLREGPHVRHRVIAVDHEDNIWTGYAEKYELEKYSAAGGMLVSMSRTSDWFKPHTEVRSPRDASSDPPNPHLRELTVDQDGVLWAALWVADPNWKAGVSAVYDPSQRNDMDKVYDTVLEAIDPASGKVMARTRSGYALKKVRIVGPDFGEPLFFGTTQQENGFIRADILQATYKHPPPTGGEE